MFISLFNTLKATGIPCSLRELLDLIAAVDKRLAFANMNEFYFLAELFWLKMKSTMTNSIELLIFILKELKV